MRQLTRLHARAHLRHAHGGEALQDGRRALVACDALRQSHDAVRGDGAIFCVGAALGRAGARGDVGHAVARLEALLGGGTGRGEGARGAGQAVGVRAWAVVGQGAGRAVGVRAWAVVEQGPSRTPGGGMQAGPGVWGPPPPLSPAALTLEAACAIAGRARLWAGPVRDAPPRASPHGVPPPPPL
jgi:hypothetical protein